MTANILDLLLAVSVMVFYYGILIIIVIKTIREIRAITRQVGGIEWKMVRHLSNNLFYERERGTSMNKFLTKVWNNKEVRWKIIIIIVSAGCSVLCSLLTKNMILTAIYIGITAVVDIISVIEELINWDRILDKIFEIKNRIKNLSWIKYWIFVVFGLLPSFGSVIKKIVISGIKIRDIYSVLFVNIFPNVCGALIVCSLVAHMSNLDERQFVSALIQPKKGLFNVIIRVIFFTCYLNAVNYKANDYWKYANYVNSAYLFFIISCGAIAMISFLSRLVDNQPFPYETKKAFPKWTMFFSALFLISCGAGPLIAKIGKHEPFLLLLNSITTIIIFVFLLWFIVRKTNQSSEEYPIVEFFIFLAFVIANCIVNLYKWDRTGDIISQLVSGGLILFCAIILLLFLGHLQSKNIKKPQKEKIEMGDHSDS